MVISLMDRKESRELGWLVILPPSSLTLSPDQSILTTLAFFLFSSTSNLFLPLPS